MNQFWLRGFSVLEGVLSPDYCNLLATRLDKLLPLQGSLKAGVRDLFRLSPELNRLVRTRAIRSVVESLLSAEAFAVRAIFFDKTPETNWYVTWHQDTTISVKEKHEVSGYDAWSKKHGIWHVRPPREVLERMVTVRLHLDPCNNEEGPLHVITDSHRRGIIPASVMQQCVRETAKCSCTVDRGGAVVMSPLLLHASPKALRPSRRRVLHFEFADIELSPPLDWYDRR
ncbi:MAG: phytanoyl-CoA dioxygenase family protein [Planctomycetales bacterium]|nr:phytanoyl-CoA dioxygenase family protein [Planctomycetales bacterium]